MKILYFIFSYIYFYLIVMERLKCFNLINNLLYLNYKLIYVIFFKVRIFNEISINVRKCSYILIKVFYFIN